MIYYSFLINIALKYQKRNQITTKFSKKKKRKIECKVYIILLYYNIRAFLIVSKHIIVRFIFYISKTRIEQIR